MYPVSEEYLEQITANSVVTNWYGYIRTVNGIVYNIDPSIIVEGSGSVTRQICDSKDLQIGTTCSAELDISLYLDGVNRYELYKGTVTMFFQLLVGDTFETVPLGEFIIAEPPERSVNVITIHAYDAMLNFNQDFGRTLIGTPYNLLTYACSACGVPLGNTQEEIANFTNGSVETYTFEELEVYTYRDLVGYIASYLCCFAYIGVDGKLYLKQYNMTANRTITEDWRFEYKPMDYETYYTSLSAYFAVTKEYEYIVLSKTGLDYDLKTNPLIQFNADDLRRSVLTNIITKLSEVSYTPFSAKTPCDPSLMVGDVVNFTGNHAVDGKLAAITKQVITICGGMTIECAGSDPNLNVLTDSEKQMQTVSSGSDKDGMYYYDYANAEEIFIRDGSYEVVIRFNYTTTKETHIDFHGEVKCQIETTEEYDEESDTYTEKDGVLYVTYFSGGEEVTEYYPVDTFFDGTHLLHLVHTWWASGNIVSTFEVRLRCMGCTITIDQGDSRAYIAGCGLIGDGAWDGATYIYDDFAPIDFSIIRKDFDEAIQEKFATPSQGQLAQSISKRNFFSTMLKGINESVHTSSLHRFSVAYNQYDMEYDNIVVSGSNWIVENQENNGIITTPDCEVDHIVRVTSAHSGNDVAYIVSFDGGETWWTYANGWAEPDYTQDVYGMFEGTMRSITTEQWDEKLNGTIMIRAILVTNASLTDIQIYTEVYQ